MLLRLHGLERSNLDKGVGTDSFADWTSKSVFGGIYAHMGFAGHGASDSTFLGAIRSSGSLRRPRGSVQDRGLR